MSKLYKKHYELIASVIHDLDDMLLPDEVATIAKRFAKALRDSSPDYDEARFLDSCIDCSNPPIDPELDEAAESLLDEQLEDLNGRSEER